MIITVMNYKGGVGKTTTSMALATAATRGGHEGVRVYDADEQASASNWADYAERADEELPFEIVEGGNYVRLRRTAERNKGLLIVDCPPARSEVTDMARDVADLIIVPTTPKPADIEKTRELVADLEALGKAYAVLINRFIPRTVALRETVGILEEMGASYFSTMIPQRENISNFFGQSFGDDLFGFETVWDEVEQFAAQLGLSIDDERNGE